MNQLLTILFIFSIAVQIGSAKNPKKSLLPIECGVRHEKGVHWKIMNGQNAGLGEFPWMAALLYVSLDLRNGTALSGILLVYQRCGGSLINENYVLTAAHCLEERENIKLVAVRLGEYDKDTRKDCNQGFCAPPTQDILVDKVIIHEDYYDDTNRSRVAYNDIGLVRLTKPAKFNDFVAPVCLPSFYNEYSDIHWLAGWGNLNNTDPSNKLQKMTTTNIVDCLEIYNIPSEKYICVKDIDRNPCAGDSGGPLVIKKIRDGLSRFYAVGIVSAGSPCLNNATTFNSSYTKVSAYYVWIINNLEP